MCPLHLRISYLRISYWCGPIGVTAHFRKEVGNGKGLSGALIGTFGSALQKKHALCLFAGPCVNPELHIKRFCGAEAFHACAHVRPSGPS